MKIYKVNELFEINQSYPYDQVSKKRHPIQRSETFIYKFVSDDGTIYFTELVNVKDEYLTACFADKENYEKGRKSSKWKYELTNELLLH